ncbi:hypothetical protein SISSUDRAFT_1039092 [Sistotremastrum suecicum HHB10207 ss-3]|uniref:Rrp15p-domain-containing protein n=1 Tax=Sistotremastrum suecicum HHB10207 ss-3 TaxID=1314776 RepID=A0A166JAY1_9AGAM|nr:hypothetical protein SISSUDRAFT_1039092 [Sistotremastrum suecicum HHB10207 ss-3]
MAPTLKRQKVQPGPSRDSPKEHEDSEHESSADEELVSGDESNDEGPSSGSEPNTDDEITAAKFSKSKKTQKRKRRATSPSQFGATLQSLLSTDTSAAPLSLKPVGQHKSRAEKEELRVKKIQDVERKEREDRGRVRDVIGEWGGENERALRKIAQRGVVKLFNAIQQSQAHTSTASTALKQTRGSGKPTLPAPNPESSKKMKASKSNKGDNLLGRAKRADLEQDEFMNLIRSGGIVSKS